MKTFIAIIFSLLILGCTPPTPATVIFSCFKQISQNNYSKAFNYVTPRVANVQSNYPWLFSLHRMYVKGHQYKIESIVLDSATQSHANCIFTFKTTQTDYSYKVQLDLVLLKNKWYIDNIWHLEDNGEIYMNALENIDRMHF